MGLRPGQSSKSGNGQSCTSISKKPGVAEEAVPVQGLGYAVSLGGFGLYNYIKMNPSAPLPPSLAPKHSGEYLPVSTRDPGLPAR